MINTKSFINPLKALVISTMMFTASCKHDNFRDLIGNEICPLSDTFHFPSPLLINNGTNNMVDFEKGDAVQITTQFNEFVPWTITIKGRASGAVVTIKGSGREIKGNNAIWKGNTSNSRFFRSETCDVILRVPCKADSLVNQIAVAKPKDYDSDPGVILITDFEIPNTKGLVKPYYNIWGYLGGKDVGVKGDSMINPPQGDYGYIVSGTDKDQNYFIGGFGHNAVPFNLPSNPDSIYFNAYVLGSRGASIRIKLKENDDRSIPPDADDGAGDESLSKELKVDWEGWKLVSIKYNEFIIDPKTAGNNKLNPERCYFTGFDLNSDPPGGTATLKVDYIVFTVGTPFQP